MEKISNILWGLVLIAVGVIFGLNALEITNINIFFDGWWTLFIIIPSFIDLFKEKNKTGAIIGLLVGASLLLACQDLISFDVIWKLLVPVSLVLIGISIIFKDQISGKIKKEIAGLNKPNGENDYCVTFGNQELTCSENFDGCELNAIFGGIDYDLRDATIKENTVINASAIFGGITIIVPKNVKVKVTSSSIFGGVSDTRSKKERDSIESDVTLYINATCIFGGVDIK